MRLTVFSDGRCTGQCVPSAVTSPPPGPGAILLNSSLVLHAAISFETFLAVGSTDASIRSITLRYLHTLVWSTPKIACSVPCVGLSFLRMSDMSKACLKRSLHRFPGSDILDSSSRNSGMSPEAIAHAPARSKIYRNSSLLHRVAECRLDSSDMTPSNTSILCRSVLVLGSQPVSLLFHSWRSRFSSPSFCSSFLSFCFRIFFRFLFSCCNLRMN